MNDRQRQSAAKYLYDVSKITLTVSVIGNIASKERFELWIVGWGLVGTLLTYVAAYLIEGTLIRTLKKEEG